LFGISRQAYYKTIKKAEKSLIREDVIIDMVIKIRKEQLNLGTRKIYHEIKSDLLTHGIKIGRDKLFEIMNKHNMLVRLKKRRAITTDSYHRFYKYPNLVKDYEPEAPNRLWVSDITYIRTQDKFIYLTMITDAYSKKILGWNLSNDLSASSNIISLKMAMQNNVSNIEGLIHHSDRGIQYYCDEYIKLMNNLAASNEVSFGTDGLTRRLIQLHRKRWGIYP
jgi:transposase InsO family protein